MSVEDNPTEHDELLGNIRGEYTSEGHPEDERLINPSNELVEYFIQYRTDDIIDALNTLYFKVNIDEDPILRQILNEDKFEFRLNLFDAVTSATLIANYGDPDDPQVGIRWKEIRNQIDVDIEFPINAYIEKLNAVEHEGELVTFEAIISDWSTKDSITYTSVYKCADCGNKIIHKHTSKLMQKCDLCDGAFEYFVPHRTEDMRRINLRQIMTDYTNNKQPSKIIADAYGRTAHKLELSTRVIVTGVFTSIPYKNEAGRRYQRFIPTIQIISMQKTEQVIEMPDMMLLKKFKDLEDQGKLVESVIDGFAFNVYGKRMEKKAAICALIGSEWVGGNSAPQIYIIFIGDPDTFKSTIMKCITKVSDNTIIVDATAVSGNGIKAIAVRMEDGTWSIRAGILPSYHGGVAGFDEFGDLKPEIYEEIKNVMIDGRVRKHVAGEDFDAPAETGIIASMNPTWDVWDDNKTFYENIQVMGKALITRWDLMFRFKIAFCNEHENEIDELLKQSDMYGKPTNLLSDHEIKLFLNYVRTIHPKVTEAAIDRRNSFFKEIRKKKGNADFETRTKNSVMKFAIALAKWHMSTEVKPEHVDEALLLFKAALDTFNLKLENGEFVKETSLKATQDAKMIALEEAFKSANKDGTGIVLINDAKSLAMSSGVFSTHRDLDRTWEQLKTIGNIHERNDRLAEWRDV